MPTSGGAAAGRREPRRRRRRQQREQARLGEPAHPVAERAGREAVARDDHPRRPRRIVLERVADRREREIAERAAALPLLEPRIFDDALGSRGRDRGPAGSPSHSTRVKPWPCFPRRSESRKWSASTAASSSANPRPRSRGRTSSGRTAAKRHGEREPERQRGEHRVEAATGGGHVPLAEVEDRPAAVARDPAQGAVGIDGDRRPHRLEERQVRVRVRVRRRSREVDSLGRASSRTARALPSPCAARSGAARVRRRRRSRTSSRRRRRSRGRLRCARTISCSVAETM